jgi:hypothetical protein
MVLKQLRNEGNIENEVEELLQEANMEKDLPKVKYSNLVITFVQLLLTVNFNFEKYFSSQSKSCLRIKLCCFQR